jgi:hypothetical protein
MYAAKLLLLFKIPTNILMGIWGHSSEQMFMKYIGKTTYDNASNVGIF